MDQQLTSFVLDSKQHLSSDVIVSLDTSGTVETGLATVVVLCVQLGEIVTYKLWQQSYKEAYILYSKLGPSQVIMGPYDFNRTI